MLNLKLNKNKFQIQMSSDKDNFSSNEGMVQKMKKRTQEFLNAANAAAARSIQMSSTGNLTDIAKADEVRDSKSQGFFEQSRKLGQIEQNQAKDDKKDQLMKGNYSFKQNKYFIKLTNCLKILTIYLLKVWHLFHKFWLKYTANLVS